MDDGLAAGLAGFFPVRIYSSGGAWRNRTRHLPGRAGGAGRGAGGTVYVGDRLGADVAGAQGVGMKGVLIEVAHRPEHDPAIVPDARITELPELPAALSRMEAS